MTKSLIIFHLILVALSQAGFAQQYSAQLLNYRTAAAFSTFGVPERGDLIYRGFGAEEIEFVHNGKLNGLALARSFEMRFLKEFSLEYQNLLIRLKGPDSYKYNSVGSISRYLSLNKVNARFMLLRTDGKKRLQAHAQIGLSRYIALNRSQSRSNSDRTGDYANDRDTFLLNANYQPLPFNVEFNAGFDCRLFKLAKRPLSMRVGINIPLRQVLSGTSYWPDLNRPREIITLPPVMQSLVLGLHYPLTR